MMFRGVDSKNDWLFGQGIQSYVRDNDAVKADIQTALQTFYQESFYEPSKGVPWFGILGQKNVDLLVLNIKKAIIKIEGVTDCYDVSVQLTADRNCVVRYVVTTIYTTQISGEVTLL
jgi:hypothetical protein